MISIASRTEGLDGMAEELIAETRKDALPLVARGAEKLAHRMRQKLSVRGGPSRPGKPPALEQGAIRDSIGRTGPYGDRGSVRADIGVGVGDKAAARVAAWKSRGVNVFEYAKLHEEGGVGADGRRYPPRSFARASEEELDAEISASWEASLS